MQQRQNIKKRPRPRRRLRRWLMLVGLGVVGGLATMLLGFLALVVWDDTGPAQRLN